MPSMNAARSALAAWMLPAAPVLAQTSTPSGNPQSAPGEAKRWDLQYGTTLGCTIMPRLAVSAGCIRTRDAGEVESTFGTAVNYVLRFW